jgi:hypothetical protein
MASIIEPLITPLNDFLSSSIAFFPNLIYAVIVLAIGWVIGEIVGRVVKELLMRFKVDHYLAKKGPMVRLTDIFPILFEWGVYLIFIREAVNILNLEFVSQVVGMIYSQIPGIIFGVVIAVVGYVIAEYVKREVQKSKIVYSKVMSNILFWLVIFVSFAIALEQTPIDTDLIDQMLLIMTASIGLGIAIALGLGLKDVISQVARDQVRKVSRRRR